MASQRQGTWSKCADFLPGGHVVLQMALLVTLASMCCPRCFLQVAGGNVSQAGVAPCWAMSPGPREKRGGAFAGVLATDVELALYKHNSRCMCFSDVPCILEGLWAHCFGAVVFTDLGSCNLTRSRHGYRSDSIHAPSGAAFCCLCFHFFARQQSPCAGGCFVQGWFAALLLALYV